jgi:hypothetical protein
VPTDTSSNRLSFASDAENEAIAKLRIESDDGTFGLETTEGGYVHQVGLTDAPVYKIDRPLAPDEGWIVDVDPKGGFVGSGSFSDAAFEKAFTAWNRGSRATTGNRVLEMLPEGSYRLVRSKRTPEAVEPFYLGNEDVPLTPNLGELVGEGPVHACVVGAPTDAPPNLNCPLVGVVLLNYMGATVEGSTEKWQHGLLLFPFGKRGESSTAGSESDLLVVIPEDGALVIDNLQGYSAPLEAAARKRWKESFAGAFAKACAESP